MNVHHEPSGRVMTSIKNHYDMNYEEALSFIKSERKFIYDFDKKNELWVSETFVR